MPLRPLMSMLLAAGLCSAVAVAQPRNDSPEPMVDNSRIDAPLFYELLIGEIELRDGDGGTAYEIYLDAARRMRDESLFRRATDIAIQARAGEQALAAARAWRTAVPGSLDAARYEVQILAGLGRVGEAVEPLQRVIALMPADERVSAIAALPRYFARSAPGGETAAVVERVLQPYLAPSAEVPAAVAAAAWTALGRVRLAGGDSAGALDAVQRAQAIDARSEPAALLAVELLAREPRAEAALQRFFAAEPPAATRNAVRLSYARSLAAQQRYTDAVPVLEQLTREPPVDADAWLALGALRLELKQPQAAEAALKSYLARLDETSRAAGAPIVATDPEVDDADDADGNAGADALAQRRSQAYLLLAQAAEQRRDFAAADAWLARIEGSDLLAVQVAPRFAAGAPGQGRAGAAQLIRATPERSPQTARAKLLAEAQLLRDASQWAAAREVMVQANARYPDDPDLLYDQAMIDEKLDRVDEMERAAAPGDRDPAGPTTTPTTRSATRWPIATCGCPRRATLIRKALELAPDDPYLVDSLGWVEYRMGNRQEALKWLRQAYSARPDPEIAAHLGEVLWIMGERDEARRVLAEARRRDAANEVLKETVARLKVDL